MMSDIFEIESEIKKLREAANKRAASLINIDASQKVIAERDHVFREKESVETECREALAARQQLLRQAQCEESVQEELEEKINALSQEVKILEMRINELNRLIAEKDTLIAALTAEKLQLDESIKSAENDTNRTLETGRAWQAAATEEISAHAATVRNRDALLTEIDRLEREARRHAEVFQDELHEQEQAAQIRIEQLTKELEYQSQKADFFIKNKNSASQKSLAGVNDKLYPPSASCADKPEQFNIALPGGEPGDQTAIGTAPLIEIVSLPQTLSGGDSAMAEAGSGSDFERVAAGQVDIPMADRPPSDHIADGIESNTDANLPVLAIAKTMLVARTNTASEMTVIPTPVSHQVLMGPNHALQTGKSHDAVGHKIKNNLDLKNDLPVCDLDGGLNASSSHNPKKQEAKAWQNKVEEYLAISNNGSIRWDRSPGERTSAASRADILESNVRKLAEFSMANVHSEGRPVENTAISGSASIDEDPSIASENKAALRKRAAIAAGVSTMTVVVFLIAGLAMGASNGSTLASPFGGLFSKLQSGAVKEHQDSVHHDKLQPQDQSNGAIKQKPAAASANDTLGKAVDPKKPMREAVL